MVATGAGWLVGEMMFHKKVQATSFPKSSLDEAITNHRSPCWYSSTTLCVLVVCCSETAPWAIFMSMFHFKPAQMTLIALGATFHSENALINLLNNCTSVTLFHALKRCSNLAAVMVTAAYEVTPRLCFPHSNAFLNPSIVSLKSSTAVIRFEVVCLIQRWILNVR